MIMEEDKMTVNKEDYLKAIYKLGGSKELVNNKQIAEVLQISPASVTEMMGKLKKEGLIEFEPYKGSRLSKEGMRAAISIVRGHRLWEVFLIRYLDYSWSEAHEDAELLEHIAPSRLIDRLAQFLDHPDYCPHGNAIPNTDGQMDSIQMQTLNHLPIGAISYIRRVKEEKELLDYLQELEVAIGKKVQVIEVTPYEGPLTIEMDGKRIQISFKAATQIYVDQMRSEESEMEIF